MTDEKIVARTCVHATYVEKTRNGEDALVVSEIIENDKGEIRPNLKVYKNPNTRFWVTQVPYRDHSDKKEFEKLSLLDEYVVPYKERDREIFRALNGYSPNFMTFDQRRKLQTSPFLYGGNMTIEALTAMKYKKELLKAGRTPHTPTTGFLDIEQSLLPDSLGQIPLIVFTAENQVYLAMNKSFMTEPDDHGNRHDVTIQDVEALARLEIDTLVNSIFAENDDLKDAKAKMPFQYHFHVGNDEVDMIKWILSKAHESKVSYVGIWNLGYDIGEIIKVLDKNNIPLSTVFAHPTLRALGVDHASYREDNRKGLAHFTQKWHWLTATAHFQFVDSMALYSYIRIVDGRESSYALDEILKKHGLGGKLKIDKTDSLSGLHLEDWHREMLSKHFAAYAIYAMWDGMALQMMEWLNNDLTAMMLGGDTTQPRFFVNQTIRVTNKLFEEWLPDGNLGRIHGGHILGTGVDMQGIRDHDIPSLGGAVLDPQNLIAPGLHLFEEWPSHATHCYAWVNDLDFAALYPTLDMVLNISKQTKISTLIKIKSDCVQKHYPQKEAVEVLCSYLITPQACGVELGTEFFNLPDYNEMDKLFTERLLHVTA